MVKFLKGLILTFILIISVSTCSDFLDEVPDNRVELDDLVNELREHHTFNTHGPQHVDDDDRLRFEIFHPNSRAGTVEYFFRNDDFDR